MTVFKDSFNNYSAPVKFHNATIKAAGREQRAQHFPSFRIVSIVEGNAEWLIGNKKYLVKEGDIVILRNSVTRKILNVYPPKDLFLEIFEFLPTSVDDNLIFLSVFYENDSCVVNCTDSIRKQITGMLQNIKEETHNDMQNKAEFLKAQLTSILILINRSFPKSSNPSCNTISRNTLAINKASAYILNNLSEDLTVERLAFIVHMSKGYFSKIFRKYVGISVSDYIRQCRILNVIQILNTRRCNILDAALDSGFTSSSGFYKTFKSVTGMTPTRYLQSPLKTF